MDVSNKRLGEISLVLNRLKNNYGGLVQIIMIIYLFADSISQNYNFDLLLILFICFIFIIVLFILVWIFDFKKVGLSGKEFDAILLCSDEWINLKDKVNNLEGKK